MTLFPIVLGLSGSVVFLVLLWKLVQRNRAAEPASADSVGSPTREGFSDEWFDSFSSFRYLPMRRILAPEEEEFWVKSVPGGAHRREEFRAERRRLFRSYLRLIAADFDRLSQGIRLSAVHAPEDRSADIAKLLSLQWTLRKLLWQAEFRLAFHWLGVQPLDATRIINELQSFEFTLRELRLGGAAA